MLINLAAITFLFHFILNICLFYICTLIKYRFLPYFRKKMKKHWACMNVPFVICVIPNSTVHVVQHSIRNYPKKKLTKCIFYRYLHDLLLLEITYWKSCILYMCMLTYIHHSKWWCFSMSMSFGFRRKGDIFNFIKLTLPKINQI